MAGCVPLRDCGTARQLTLFRRDFKPLPTAPGGANNTPEYWIFWNYMGIPQLGATQSRLNPHTHLMHPELLRYMLGGYFGAKAEMARLGMGHFGCPMNVNSGVHAVFMALQVRAYGFLVIHTHGPLRTWKKG